MNGSVQVGRKRLRNAHYTTAADVGQVCRAYSLFQHRIAPERRMKTRLALVKQLKWIGN